MNTTNTGKSQQKYERAEPKLGKYATRHMDGVGEQNGV